MSLVRSRHLRSSSKRRIHPPLLSFFRDDDIFRSTGVHINASSPSKQDLYEHPRRVPGHATIKHSLDSEEAKKSENDFAFAFTAKVLSNGDEKNASLESFKKVDSNVKLFFGGGGGSSVVEAKEWTTYPGFFAKGGLDIMTSFLLDSILEEDPEKSSPSSSARLKKGICSDKTKRVMDFCCGSGVIGYALRNALAKEKTEKKTKKKKVKLTMLDADAVALEAAKQNFSSLVSGNDDENDDENNIEYLLSDGFPQKTTVKPCELILTNPPVHYNAKPDFRVLGHMLTELPNVLKKRKERRRVFLRLPALRPARKRRSILQQQNQDKNHNRLKNSREKRPVLRLEDCLQGKV